MKKQNQIEERQEACSGNAMGGYKFLPNKHCAFISPAPQNHTQKMRGGNK